MSNKYDVNRLSRLIHYYNHLVHEYDIPLGSIQVQLDDGYVGEVYSIDFEFVNGTFILANDKDGQLFFSFVCDDGTDKSGVVNDYTPTEIAEMIKKVII